MSESKLQSDILMALCLDTRVAWAMIITTGKFKVKGGFATVGHYATEDMKRKIGTSDILGQMRDGRLLAIEVKLPGKEPTIEQHRFLDTVKKNNGVAGWVTTINEAYQILEAGHVR